jgi:hypothetical protein
MLLFEPFRIAADKESFDGIGKLFEAEAGVESVLPGYELFNETTLGYGSLEGCSVFPSEQLARGKFDATLNVEGYRFVKIVQWRPSDEVTGLASRAPVAPAVAATDEAALAIEDHARREAEEKDRREVEETARLNREVADFAARQVADNEASRRRADAERKAYEQERAEYDRAMELNRSQRAAADLLLREYDAAQRRHARCLTGDKQACADIAAGKPALADAGQLAGASTETDATRCVASPVVSPDPAFRGSTQAVVINGCEAPVDVRVCLMRTGGWNCAVAWNLAPQARWAHTSFESDGQVFWDARVSTSSRQLASP